MTTKQPAILDAPTASASARPHLNFFRSLRTTLLFLAVYAVFSVVWSTPLNDFVQDSAPTSSTGSPVVVHPPSQAPPTKAVPLVPTTTITVAKKAVTKEDPKPMSKTPSLQSTSTSSLRPSTTRRNNFNQKLPSCARSGTRARTFLMVFMGHSGSSAIMAELRQHPQTWIKILEKVDHNEEEHNTTLALETTRAFFEEGLAQGLMPAFKIRPKHILNEPEKWAALAREYDTRIIWQYRRNMLKHAVGEYAYRFLGDEKTKQGLKTDEDVQNRCKSGAGCSFKIEKMEGFHGILKSLLNADYQIAAGTAALADGRDCVYESRYEDYLYHREGTMRDIQEFLGLEPLKMDAQIQKATGDNLCEVVENFEELCRHFYGCAAWRHLFEDAVNGCSCTFAHSPRHLCAVDFQ